METVQELGKPIASTVDNSELGPANFGRVEDHEVFYGIEHGFAGEVCHYGNADFIAAVWTSTDMTPSIVGKVSV